MGTEILRPQDCLIDRMRVGPPVLSRRRSYAANPSSNPNPKVCRKPFVKPESKKRVPQSEPLISKKSTVDDANPARNIVMGHVTILKRGESLDSKKKNETQPKKKLVSGDLVVFGTERLGPDPEMVPKQIKITDLKLMMSPNGGPRTDVYAGSAFSLSPSPSSLPLPSFYKKKEGSHVVVDDSATKGLRRLLRLDDE
ncbi:hypothetical protein BVC80_9003g14 [Macleaya cordata]|uniref:Uncharacterized protein n=1 Tax=Macleaya cordata TaxID=56857 RepID=A0A200QLR2_MACCD|nr:hypothetical protein BVC80_9003g14 [Macleaya cordata]